MNNIKEFISISTERPSDVIKETIDYMTNIARRSDYVIFQSSFGYLDGDSPFTCIIWKSNPYTYNIDFWSVDWPSFDIQFKGDKYGFCAYASLRHPKDEFNSLSTAKEIVEHSNFDDRKRYADHSVDIPESFLPFELYRYLGDRYNPEEPFGFNPTTEGIVAVVYRE